MTQFSWDPRKEAESIAKHGIDFKIAEKVFNDTYRCIRFDPAHSATEERFFCLGKIGEKILTVRFTLRGHNIRIIGAGYWRKGEKIYEKEKKKRKL